MTKDAKKTYEAAPVLPPEEQRRYETMLEVLSGALTVTDGAKRLGLSRNHFQTLMHRGLKGLAEAIRPKAAGRPAKPTEQAKLEEQLATMKRENERLTQRVEMTDRLLGVAGDYLRGQSGRGRERRSKPSATKKDGSTSDEDARTRLTTATELRSSGFRWSMIAGAVGTSERTLLRWRTRATKCGALRLRRGPGPRLPPSTTMRAEVEALVRESRGLIGAASLSHGIEGVSRRQAAAIKWETKRDMERERIAACGRVQVAHPGIVRGFDAMHLRAREGTCFALVAADAAVPYRTASAIVDHYDATAVAKALEEDFEENGPPIVLRLDRAKCHEAPEVKAVLERHEVLALQGPPRHPRYYGQLERQNREHRAWLNEAATREREDLETDWRRMNETMNSKWHRATLGWRTAEDVWRARPVIRIDRTALRHEVDERARSLGETIATLGEALRKRLAIEITLSQHGLLKLHRGGLR